MTFDFVNHPYFEKLVRVICLTLMHSLWQGLVVAVLAGAILMLTKKSKPAFRYNILVILLIGFFVSNCVTFWILNRQVLNAAKISGHVFLDSKSSNAASYIQKTFSSETNVVSMVTDFCTRNAEIIVAIWFLMFIFKSLQATTGFLYLKKIRNKDIYEPENDWKVKFAVLAGKLGIDSQIALKESGNITVPMVIGFFKPVVLVPLGMLANLPAVQIEAILLHELAHIKRKDYLVNLMQIFCENVFFFNPALLWISSLIREEREHCCDDLAIEVTQNKTSFVHALVSFQEYNLAATSFTIAFSKKRNHLLDRVKRIINNNNKPLDAMEKLFVTISLISAAVLSAAVSHIAPEPARSLVAHQEKQVAVAEVALPEFVVAPPRMDTLPKNKQESSTTIHSANVYSENKGVSTYSVHVDGKAYDIIQKDGKTTHLNIDGKEIPEKEFASHQAEIDDILAKVKVAHEEAEVHRAEADKHRAEADVHRKEADQHRLQADKMRAEADVMREQAELGRKQADLSRIQADKMRGEADLMRKDAEKDRAAYEQMQNDLINDLISTGVIKNKSDLSYRLGQDELTVNGVKQSAELHKKLKEKYIQSKVMEMVYNYKGRTGYTTTGFVYTK